MKTPLCLGSLSLAVLTSLAAGGCSSSDHEKTQFALDQTVLGTAQSFAVLGGSTVTNTGATTVQGSLGVDPGLAVTGFPPGLVIGGTIHAGDEVARQAKDDVTTAYLALLDQAPTANLSGQDLGGMTLTAGVYAFSSSAQLTGTLTLDAQGDPDASFTFQIASTLTTATGSSVLVINGGDDCKVFWQVGSSATLGTTTAFGGNLVALTSITLNTGAQVRGRTLARNGAVTLDTNDVSIARCGSTGAAQDAGGASTPDAAAEVDAGLELAPDATGVLPDAEVIFDAPPRRDATPEAGSGPPPDASY